MNQDSFQKTQRGNFHASPLVACELCSGKTKRKKRKNIFVILEDFSRYIYCFPLENKQPSTLTTAFMELYGDIFERFPFLHLLDETIGFCHMDNGGQFKR